jgi:hypothetical protein
MQIVLIAEQQVKTKPSARAGAQPQLVAGTERGTCGGDRCSAELAAGCGWWWCFASGVQSRKKSAGHPGCFQCAIDWHKPPGISRRKGHKNANFGLKKKPRRCVSTPLSARLAQMDSAGGGEGPPHKGLKNIKLRFGGITGGAAATRTYSARCGCGCVWPCFSESTRGA